MTVDCRCQTLLNKTAEKKQQKQTSMFLDKLGLRELSVSVGQKSFVLNFS